MITVEPEEILKGISLVVAPHMDDGVLACGGTIAALKSKANIHFVYATDGARSPVPDLPWQGKASSELPAIRANEAKMALATLGITETNIHFVGLPDGRLKAHQRKLEIALAQLVTKLEPSSILLPFRYDRHPDHLALHQAMVNSLKIVKRTAELIEYFVYYRWAMLSSGDLRNYIQSDMLLVVDTQPYTKIKQKALGCFESQTTCYFPWQKRPIIPRERVVELSQGPELFVRGESNKYPGMRIFKGQRTWIRLVFLVEPRLKKVKDRLLALRNDGA